MPPLRTHKPMFGDGNRSALRLLRSEVADTVRSRAGLRLTIAED
jgi:hypothetical protein